MKNKLYRNITITRGIELKTLEDGKQAVPISISSEAPYLRDRINGHSRAYEVLVHDANAINLQYLFEGAPFCFEHDTWKQIGVLRNVRLDPDKVLRADVVFSQSGFAQEILQDIIDTIRTRVSVGYSVEKYEDAGVAEDGIPIVRATQWTPFESSIVSIPADLTIGVNKSMNTKDLKELIDSLTEEEKAELASTLQAGSEKEATLEAVVDAVIAEMASGDDETKEEEVTTEDTADEGTPSEEVDEEDNTSSGTKQLLIDVLKRAAKSRTKENTTMNAKDIEKITTLATKNGMTDRLPTWLSEGFTYEKAAAEILESRSNSDRVGAPAVHTRTKTTTVGGAVRDWLKGENSEVAEKGLDQARAMGRSINTATLYVPTNEPIFERTKFTPVRRDATVYNDGATGAQGVGKEFMSWEETLRESSLLARIGGQTIVLNDIGHVPYFSVASTSEMLAETGSATTKAVEVGAYTWAPKRINARYSFSDLMGRLNGSYDFESELYNDLMSEGIRKLDSQIWGGTGTSNIIGLQYDSNVTTMNTSGSFSLESGSAMRSHVANNNVNVDEGVFVVAHSVHGQIFASPAFGAGSGKSVLEALQTQNPVYGTGFLAQPIGGKYAAIFLVPKYVTAATFGAIEITRDNLTAKADGQTILNLDIYADSVVRQPGAVRRWHNITV